MTFDIHSALFIMFQRLFAPGDTETLLYVHTHTCIYYTGPDKNLVLHL